MSRPSKSRQERLSRFDHATRWNRRRWGDTFDRLDTIAVPTLVTCSVLDVIAAPHHSREIAGQIRGAEFVEMTGTGHVSLMESPEEFAAICLDFSSRVS